eukprot:GILI01029679.1.p1 GENE.GILI01029679.1~~GILI01029679.1.p1  ORF type:complete len:184 (-),score=29.65 GILI01029679.1:44-595(-)
MAAPPPNYDSAPPAYYGAVETKGASAAVAPQGSGYQKVGAGQVVYPAQYVGATGQVSSWSTGLCDCFHEGYCDVCLCGFFCTTCQITQSAAWLEGREFSAGDCCLGFGMAVLNNIYGLGLPITWWCNCKNRERVKERFNIVEDGKAGMQFKDYFVSCCCAPCASCQVARELAIRGLRPRPSAM